MNYCLELNDDILKTMERYKDIKRGRKPAPYSKSNKSPQKESF